MVLADIREASIIVPQKPPLQPPCYQNIAMEKHCIAIASLIYFSANSAVIVKYIRATDKVYVFLFLPNRILIIRKLDNELKMGCFRDAVSSKIYYKVMSLKGNKSQINNLEGVF